MVFDKQIFRFKLRIITNVELGRFINCALLLQRRLDTMGGINSDPDFRSLDAYGEG